MSKITLLSDETINQIAAGEVVEAPACVVKELIENALDAGASKITIQIVGGGLSKISIQDNGSGMSPADARMSLVRHATSKLKKAEDLLSTSTMGFRGEALAAIAAVSDLSIETSLSDADLGTHLIVEKGEIIREELIRGGIGTTIEVLHLFANSPVRRSFQPSEKANATAIRRIVESLALSAPKTAFTLIMDEKCEKLFPTPSNSNPMEALRRRLIEIIGSDKLIPITIQNSEGEIWGYVGHPELAEKTRRLNWLFINERAVTSRRLEEIVKAGFATSIEEGSAPLFCLHMKLPFEEIDINIHPKKRSVDFHMPRALGSLLSQEITRALTPKKTTDIRLFETGPTLNMEVNSGNFSQKNLLEPSPLFEKPLIEIYHLTGPYALFSYNSSDLWACDTKQLAKAYFFEEIKKPSLESIDLLNPIPLSLSLATVDWIEDPAFSWLGFRIELTGPLTAQIHAIPKSLPKGSVIDITDEILGLLCLQKNNEKLEHVTLIEKVTRRLKKKSIASPSRAEVQFILQEIFADPAARQNPLYQRALYALDQKNLSRLFG